MRCVEKFKFQSIPGKDRSTQAPRKKETKKIISRRNSRKQRLTNKIGRQERVRKNTQKKVINISLDIYRCSTKSKNRLKRRWTEKIEHEEENTKCFILEDLQHFIKFSVPITLFLKYFFFFFSASLIFR